MTHNHTTRYHADPAALSAMKRDGIGWGHDIRCGCMRGLRTQPNTGPVAKLITWMKG